MSDFSVRELPLFPLPDVVLFPQQLLPLHIFESRYRMLLQTVLETDKRFGIVRINPENGEMAEIGCCAEVLASNNGRRSQLHRFVGPTAVPAAQHHTGNALPHSDGELAGG